MIKTRECCEVALLQTDMRYDLKCKMDQTKNNEFVLRKQPIGESHTFIKL